MNLLEPELNGFITFVFYAVYQNPISFNFVFVTCPRIRAVIQHLLLPYETKTIRKDLQDLRFELDGHRLRHRLELVDELDACVPSHCHHSPLSLSFSHSLLVRGLVSCSLRSRHCVSDEMRACNATQRSAARRSANCICSRRPAGRSLYRRRESCCCPVSERVAPPRDQEEPQKCPVLSTCRPRTIIHPLPADLLTSGSTHSQCLLWTTYVPISMLTCVSAHTDGSEHAVASAVAPACQISWTNVIYC